MSAIIKLSKSTLEPNYREDESMQHPENSLSEERINIKPTEEIWVDRKMVKKTGPEKFTYLSEELKRNLFDPTKSAESKSKEKRKPDIKCLDTNTGTYKCTTCKLLSARKGMVNCSDCKQWYHTCCFSPSLDFSFELSILKTNLLCSSCSKRDRE